MSSEEEFTLAGRRLVDAGFEGLADKRDCPQKFAHVKVEQYILEDERFVIAANFTSDAYNGFQMAVVSTECNSARVDLVSAMFERARYAELFGEFAKLVRAEESPH